MLTLPAPMTRLLRPFESVFRETTWEHALVLLLGAILAPAKRTVTAALSVMGLRHEAQFQSYHRVLNRAAWSGLALSRILLSLLLAAFVAPAAPVIVGLDETIERRRGNKIAARGIYRDPVRSSRSHFVKTSGLRWMCMLLLAPIPWAKRVWALPFLTVLAPSERYYQERGRCHKPMLHWARQMIGQVRRWLPTRTLVVVADSTYAALDLLAYCAHLRNPVTLITRLRLDAALYAPAPARPTGTRGRPRKKGARQPTLAQRLTDPATTWETITVAWYGGVQRTIRIATGTAIWYHSGKPPVSIRWVLMTDPGPNPFEPQALLSTDPTVAAQQMVEWFVLRWQVEVTLEESRAHLGVETQRQWSDRAIARTTPLLLGLFSLVTLLAHQFLQGRDMPIRPAAWYTSKRLPTFSDTLAFVRQQLWPVAFFGTSQEKADVIEIPRSLFERLSETVAYAA
ncbi:MAG: transposase [Chloroflexaceae bacterium]